ncbi:glycosyltransferase [Metabacillus halosaccharovorans]|uniref:glycosyltransferase n=1 Tax=Metabacillus halosaccharovorans TaxID=930124 RepID=UPI0034D00E01
MTDQLKKNIHVIVATGVWNLDNLRYRRHRFAEYLSKLDNTEEVIWVCPSTEMPNESFVILENGIKEFHVPDLHKNRVFRFARYFDIFNQKHLNKLVRYLESKSEYTHYLWYTFPGFPYLGDAHNWTKVTYDCSDLWATSMTGSKNLILKLREESILSAEKRIIIRADTVFCTSDFLHENVLKITGVNKNKVNTLENGVEFALFTKDDSSKVDYDLEINNGPILGFIGGIKPKLDFALLSSVMEARPDWDLLLVGPDGTNGDEDFVALKNLKNVKWIDKVPPTEVPAYMKKIDIGILPYKQSIYNQAVFPLKLFEFLAVGKPVVGMNLPSTKKYAEDNVFEYIEDVTATAFISKCERLYEEKEEKIKRRIKIAKQKDWNIIFSKMVDGVIGKN